MAINKERKLMWVHTASIHDYMNLNELKRIVDVILKKHPIARVQKYHEDYDENEYVGIFIEVPETDKQFAERLTREAERAERNEERDRLEFERLQKKFGGSK